MGRKDHAVTKISRCVRVRVCVSLSANLRFLHKESHRSLPRRTPLEKMSFIFDFQTLRFCFQNDLETIVFSSHSGSDLWTLAIGIQLGPTIAEIQEDIERANLMCVSR